MPLHNTLRPNLKRDRLRRLFRSQTGYLRVTTLGNDGGVIKGSRFGHLWVRDIGSSDANGNISYGAAYQLPIKPGATLELRPTWKVEVQSKNGQEYISGMVFDDLVRAEYDPHQTNALDPSVKLSPLIENLQNLQSFPNGNATVTVMPSIYRKSDGTYAVLGGTDGLNIDILTGNVPSADNQVIACLWLDESDGSFTVTVSSEETIDTDLHLDYATALSLVNECAASAPANAIGINSYIIKYDTTGLYGVNKHWDLRGIVGIGNATDNITADTFILNDGSELTLSANTNGVITVTHTRHTVDTFADASTGDLKTVNGLAAGEVCIITASHTDRTIVVKHTGGTDISCANGLDIPLDDTIKSVLLMGNLAGTGVNAYPLFDEITSSSINTFANKTISASTNTLIQGSGVTKTLASDVCVAGTDRNLIIAAETGTSDNLIEVTGLAVGESVLLRADAGDTITVVHNSGSATVKIHLHNNANINLDEQNPLRLTLIASNVLSEDVQPSAGSSTLNNYTATTAPTANDDSGDGYSVGSRWFDVTNDKIYECIDATLTAAIWIEVVGRTQTQTLTGKTISTSANTVGIGALASKTIASDVVSAGTDRNLVISAESGVQDALREITGLSVGETVYVRAASGHTISLQHNHASATVKIHLLDNAETQKLDEQNPVILTLVETNVLAQSHDSSIVAIPKANSTQLDPTTDVVVVYDTSDGKRVNVLLNELPISRPEGVPFVDPNLKSWTNLNNASGGTFTVDVNNKRLTILADGDASIDIRGWYTTAPSVPYTITAKIIGTWQLNTNTGLAFGFRENATGELALMHYFSSSAVPNQIGNYKYTSPTAFSASYASLITVPIPPTWFRLEDDNTNRIVSFSVDGINWEVYHTVGRTDFLTADQIVFGAVLQANASFNLQVSLLSYEES